MHDYDAMSDYLAARIAALDAATQAGHQWAERCLQCERRDHPGACEMPQRTRVQDDPDCVSPAVAAASRTLAASEKLLNAPDDPRMVDGFGIVFGQGYEHSR